MIIEIGKDNLCVGINTFGAELEYIKINNVNILWSRSSLWLEQSPLLFPNIGALKDEYYIYNEKKYQGLVHGFAKRSEFKVEQKTGSKVLLSLGYTCETLAVFPFKFNLLVKYQIINNEVVVSFKVKNLDDKTIYFGLGIHPGFSYQGLLKILGKLELKINDQEYEQIDFDKSFIINTHKENLKTMTFKEMSNKLVNPRTLCYKDLQVIDLKGNSCRIEIKHKMPYTAFWQKVPEGDPQFLCIEAWCGLPDLIDTDHVMENKTTLQPLSPGSIFETNYCIKYINE